MRFVKSHGAGNDFVLIEDLPGEIALNAAFVAAVCDRHFGVGGDGLIRVARSDRADLFMDYYNADGDVAEMCGNGIRTMARYLADRGHLSGDAVSIETRAGVKDLTLLADGGIRVDMGEPILDRASIPVAGDGDPLHVMVEAEGYTFDAACVSMGNPHAILLVDRIDALPFERLGPAIETHELFPAKTNVEFVEVLNRGEVRVRVWERGVGETLACGTGACATAVATSLREQTDRTVAVHLPGGTLEIEWTAAGTVLMTGPAEEVFEGEIGDRLASLLPRRERVTE